MEDKKGVSKGLVVLLIILIIILVSVSFVALELYFDNKSPEDGKDTVSSEYTDEDLERLDEEDPEELIEETSELEEDKAEQVVVDEEELKEIKGKLEESYDDMEDITWYKPKGDLFYPANNNEEQFSFYVYVGRKDDRYWLRLQTSFARRDWVFTEELLIRNDSQRTIIPIDYSEDRKGDVISGGVHEWVDIVVDDALLIKLGALVESTETKIRFQGATHNADYTINSQQREQIRNVLDFFEVVK